MIIIATQENGEGTDWIDEEELDLNALSIPLDADSQAYPIYSMKEHFYSPWEIDEL